ncbi:uncharacterized protein LOC131257616 [Magnolia sinica]|uniref:uncharacterized protein LOC131257616 n=1 Tax=Magnolia sinica TaxID=86752 RepID=UPI00265AB543|nr:uncharacterized protein LOC131257616 [Magnolia sinica]
MSGGGGIYRGDKGNFLFAFSTGYGLGSNKRAELHAVYDGLILCLDNGLDKIEVESDSKVVIDLLFGKSPTPWQWRPLVSKIVKLKQRRSFSFRLIQREGNGPADGMAREGRES